MSEDPNPYLALLTGIILGWVFGGQEFGIVVGLILGMTAYQSDFPEDDFSEEGVSVMVDTVLANPVNRPVPAVRNDQSMVEIAWAGQLYDLTDPVSSFLSDDEVKAMVTEALRGGLQDLPPNPAADISSFVVDKYPPREGRPWSMFSLRPKTEYG